MTRDKPICSLSLDLDNQWSYMKTHGDSGWESFPSYLDLVVPRFLQILGDFGWKITVFVVGQDAALDKNHDALKMISDAGHEIGNHSFNHEPWLHLYSRQQIEEEIAKAEQVIEVATGERPRGFRGPGYSMSSATLEVLAERGYLYDASTFPTFLGPLARAYYFLTSKLDDSQRHQRKRLFGSVRDGLQPLKPYLWGLGETDIVEIPVTTMPVFRLPFHFSYLHYISTFSPALSLLYLRAAVLSCRATGIAPSLLLHPLDFLGSDDVPELSFFPAMKNESVFKLALVERFLRVIQQRFSVETMGTFQQTVRASKNTKTRHPGTAG